MILLVIDDPLVVFGNSAIDRPPSRGFQRAAALARGASSELVIDDPLVVFGGWRRGRVGRAQNSARDQRPSRGFRRAAPLARGASSEFFSESATLLWFWAGDGAGAWSVLRLLFVVDDPLVVFGRVATLARGAPSEFSLESTTTAHTTYTAHIHHGTYIAPVHRGD